MSSSILKLEIIADGFVSQRVPGSPTAATAGPRCVVGSDGTISCTFMAQSALGCNDFKPMLSRSHDGGRTWSEAALIWPETVDRYSIFGSISAGSADECFFYGMRTSIECPGEPAWSDELQGLKQNELVWSRSTDRGAVWEPFRVIPMPVPGSAEAPGALCHMRSGRLVCCYSPYKTFDPLVQVKSNRVICLSSGDAGRTWSHATMHLFPEPDANGAEAWVVELTDGSLLGTSWHIYRDQNRPNAYALSRDGGMTWSQTRSTGIIGQSTGLASLPDGRALFVYNQRQLADPGVWLAVVRPTEHDFGVIANQRVWAAEVTTTRGKSDAFEGWTSFAFGEPSVTPLPDGTVLVVLWAQQPSGFGIRYVKLRLH